MTLKCPRCGCEYDIQSTSEIKHFNMKCTSCGSYISTENVFFDDSIPYARVADRPKTHSKWRWTPVIVALVLGVMAFTRPKKAEHTAKVRELVYEEICKGDDAGSLIAQGVTVFFGSALVDGFIDMALHVDDYFFFNIGRIKYQDVDKVVSVGVFNSVFLLVVANDLREDMEPQQ